MRQTNETVSPVRSASESGEAVDPDPHIEPVGRAAHAFDHERHEPGLLVREERIPDAVQPAGSRADRVPHAVMRRLGGARAPPWWA